MKTVHYMFLPKLILPFNMYTGRDVIPDMNKL